MRIVSSFAAVLMAGVTLSACATVGADQAAPSFDAARISEDIRVLSSDAYEGRGIATPAEEKVVQYLSAQYAAAGFEPGGPNGQWTQDVILNRFVQSNVHASLKLGDWSLPMTQGSEVAISTRRPAEHVSLKDAPLVFVGYGINAPERQWNDFKGQDLRGKILVVLVNDADFEEPALNTFGGKAMTYYGRWTYKYEEAARQGAAAALIIHDDAGAGYGWDVVKNSWSGAQFDLPASADPEPRLPLQGWLTGEVAAKLFADAGLDLEALRAAANKPGFKAVPLGGASFTAKLNSSIRETSSRNILARLPGTERPDEAIVYTAHWDHLGDHSATHGGDKAAAATEGEDHVYNGAIDNATGVAGVLEIAEAFTVQDPKPARSLVFLLVTLEESGLLGSKYYAANPVIPLKDTVAVVNLDAMSVVGPTKDFVVIGLGNSELDNVLKPIAEAQGRVLVEEDGVEKGFFFRSDHFSFAKFGVPALYAKGGIDHVEKGVDYGREVQSHYTNVAYHKPADEFDPNWDLRGVVQDLQALYGVGRELAGNEAWPNYVEGNAFKAARDASRAEAAAP
ncbi:MAG TPA: peptidase M20 [Arenimonas sp.]|nr:peptidase M20 [Arenimonas sp.]